MVVPHRDSCTKYMGWIGHISEVSQFSGTIPHHPMGLAKISSCFHPAEAAPGLASELGQKLSDRRPDGKSRCACDVPIFGTRMGFLGWPEFWHLPLEKTERPCGLLSTSFDPFASLRLVSGQGSPAEARAQCCKKCDFHSEWTRPAAAPLRSLTLEADHLKFRRSTN